MHVKLVRLQDVLQRKLAVVSPAIDTCEIVAARGNTSLEAVLPLAAGLSEELSKLGDIAETGKSAAGQQQVTASVLEHVERVIATIDDLVPFLQLALQSCGARVSSSLPTSISPGRLLQASSAVSLAASRFAAHSQFGPVQPPGPVQVCVNDPVRTYVRPVTACPCRSGPSFLLECIRFFSHQLEPRMYLMSLGKKTWSRHPSVCNESHPTCQC